MDAFSQYLQTAQSKLVLAEENLMRLRRGGPWSNFFHEIQGIVEDMRFKILDYAHRGERDKVILLSRVAKELSFVLSHIGREERRGECMEKFKLAMNILKKGE